MTAIPPPAKPYRVGSIDILRGIVMIIMAIDHTRDFFHAPAFIANPLDVSSTTPWIFFTRWITHFCAPTFIFLSGLSAFLSARKKTRSEASAFLFKRGCWLIIVELVIVTFGITFNPGYNLIVLQVIWAIGTSMILLALLLRTSFTVMLITGLVLFFGHNIIDFIQPPSSRAGSVLFQMLLSSPGSTVPLNATHALGLFYTVLPWTGVMILGYCIGKFFANGFPVGERRRMLLTAGFALIGLFIVLRLVNVYGDPVLRQPRATNFQTFLDFINTTKYPPSLLYLCMTIGPSLLALAFLENVKAGWTKVVSVYGRVPFFYYVLHFYLLHLVLVIIFFATHHTTEQISEPQNPFFFRPAIFGYGLPGVYLIWFCVVAALYLPCKWFDRYKRTHSQWWLKYL